MSGKSVHWPSLVNFLWCNKQFCWRWLFVVWKEWYHFRHNTLLFGTLQNVLFKPNWRWRAKLLWSYLNEYDLAKIDQRLWQWNFMTIENTNLLNKERVTGTAFAILAMFHFSFFWNPNRIFPAEDLYGKMKHSISCIVQWQKWQNWTVGCLELSMMKDKSTNHGNISQFYWKH